MDTEASPAGRGRKYWAFQANPEFYDIEQAVHMFPEDSWTTKGRDIRVGDRALIWKTLGRSTNRGIVGFAEVLSDPEILRDDSPFWITSGRAEPEERVRIRYVLPLDPPLWFTSETRIDLDDLSVVRGRGTVFAVSLEQWERVIRRVGGWPDTLADNIHKFEETVDFDPLTIMDSRDRIARAVVMRRGQPAFRENLLRAYGGRCAISGCDVKEVLEAAHIVPYWGDETNHIQNGLLLRSDIHTLFDLGLITLDPDTMKILVDEQLLESPYGDLNGNPLHLPVDESDRPSINALKSRQENALRTAQDS